MHRLFFRAHKNNSEVPVELANEFAAIFVQAIHLNQNLVILSG
jgi:hypothetical protein